MQNCNIGHYTGSPFPTPPFLPSALECVPRWQAVYEEALETEDFYGRKKPPRDRILGGRVTPNAPTYMKGAVAKDFENYLENESPTAPQLGVSFSESTGISVSSIPRILSNLFLLHTDPALPQVKSCDLLQLW